MTVCLRHHLLRILIAQLPSVITPHPRTSHRPRWQAGLRGQVYSAMFSGLCDPIYGRERGWVQDAGWFPSMFQKNLTMKSLITVHVLGEHAITVLIRATMDESFIIKNLL